MSKKPLVTFSGDKRLFSSLSSALHQNLPQEAFEWRRSFGRPAKNVFVDAKFVPFNDNILLEEDSKCLIDYAFFHTYWTECYDLDAYKATVREDISNWITKLKARNINEWLIISVENADGKKGNKAKLLPRTTVLDRIKTDFVSKQSERCISVLHPFKSDSRAAESWYALLQRLRSLILQSYNKTLNKFEENMRAQRERRNESGWNFCDYFLLQEELAFVYEILGLYDDALVQYDELDALFTQFVLNSVAGETPEWLVPFCQPCSSWSGLSLSPSERILGDDSRKLIVDHKVTILDFRNYLFCHQSSLLLMLSRPWEVAQRALPFMHNCVNELLLLEITMPEGSVACWVFLTCMEVLQSCERFNDSSHIEAYSLYTADLWAYARNKLHKLGVLCGLMPDLVETSEQLHLVVGLVSGIGSDPSESEVVVQSPRGKLKEALSSRSAFQKYYLEMSELAMGTFKHIGRIRSARLIGIDLAHFYMKLKEPLKASVFYSDALKTYKEENWSALAIKTQLELVSSYEQTQETTKYVKTCAQLATSRYQVSGLDEDEKIKYFHKMVETAEKIESAEPLLMKMDDMFIVSDVHVTCEGDSIITGDKVTAKLKITNLFPETINNASVQISLKYNKSLEEMTLENKKLSKRDSWGFFPTLQKMPSEKDNKNSLDFFQHFEYQQDQTLSSSSILCKNSQTILSHSDSHHWIMKARDPVKEDVTLSMELYNLNLESGCNELEMSILADVPGVYSLVQLSIICSNMEFILPAIYPSCSFNVITEEPSLHLQPITTSLLSGIDQNITLNFKSGSNKIEGKSVVLKSSAGLLIKDVTSSSYVSQLNFELPVLKPFESFKIPLTVYAALKPHKDTTAVEHRITITCSELSQLHSNIQLSFSPPFHTTFRSHSAYCRKFIQVQVHGMTNSVFQFKDHKLCGEETDPDTVVSALNPIEQHLVVSSNQQASYIWEIDANDLNPDVDVLKFTFSVMYRLHDNPQIEDSWKLYSFDFKLTDFKTIYILRSRVEPSKGSEFCRASSMCQMHIHIQQIEKDINSNMSLMYEVIAEQTMWAVIERTSGVLSIGPSGRFDVVLDVKPLAAGFLPLPTVRLSKYIPAENNRNQGTPTKDSGRNSSDLSNASTAARLKPFSPGQVFNASRAVQVHVLPATTSTNVDVGTASKHITAY